MDVRGANLPEQGLCLGIEPNQRLVPFTVINRNGSPTELGSDTGGKSFRHRFLGSPSGGVMFVRVFERAAVGLLFLAEHPFDEVVTVTPQCRMNAFNFNNIAAKSDQNAAGWKGNVHGRVTAIVVDGE